MKQRERGVFKRLTPAEFVEVERLVGKEYPNISEENRNEVNKVIEARKDQSVYRSSKALALVETFPLPAITWEGDALVRSGEL